MLSLQNFLGKSSKPLNIGFVASFVPRKCGIATFTRDLTEEINKIKNVPFVKIIALNNQENYNYSPNVVCEIEQNEEKDYTDCAEYVNSSELDIICLQHEYGLFGGEDGNYILNFMRTLEKPIVTTFHTILEHPTEGQRQTLSEVANLSKRVVAMISTGKERLIKIYGVDPKKIVLIPHGVADQPKSKQTQKLKFNWGSRPVLTLSGLINPNKGIEYVIEALPEIKKKFPNILFVVVGQTHPSIIKNDGEVYRDKLKGIIEANKLEQNVLFINKYLELPELLNYFDACDIYLTPHLDPQQITSGTLAYALGMGKPCISTPYIYAKELFKDGAGILVDYKDSAAIAREVLSILSNPKKQQQLGARAYRLGRAMTWPIVAASYYKEFENILKNN